MMWSDTTPGGGDSRSRSLIFRNAQIVTDSDILSGALEVRGSLIAAVKDVQTTDASEIDCNGDFLLPGFIDVHTDHFEKHTVPRAGVFWPTIPGILVYDAVVASAGITTVFDSLCLGAAGKPYRKQLLPKMIDGIRASREAGLLRAEHLLHLRADILDPELEEQLTRYIDEPTLRFITLMDDGAERRSDEYYARVQRSRGLSDAEVAEKLRESHAMDSTVAARTRPWVVEMARSRNIPVANHDDTRTSDIIEAQQLGVSILEFAITEEAAAAAKAAGMTVIAGAPNVVNGGSHFGNVSAADLVLRGMAQILCSDYVPASLVQAAFMLTELKNGPSLAEAVSTISRNPAKLFGLADRGVLAVGKRADIVRVTMVGNTPVIKAVWREGRRIF